MSNLTPNHKIFKSNQQYFGWRNFLCQICTIAFHLEFLHPISRCSKSPTKPPKDFEALRNGNENRRN